MEIFVHKYLTMYYQVGDNIICELDGLIKYELCKELVTLFGITSHEAILFANRWSIIQSPNIDLSMFWKNTKSRFVSPGVYSTEKDSSFNDRLVIAIDETIKEMRKKETFIVY